MPKEKQLHTASARLAATTELQLTIGAHTITIRRPHYHSDRVHILSTVPYTFNVVNQHGNHETPTTYVNGHTTDPREAFDKNEPLRLNADKPA